MKPFFFLNVKRVKLFALYGVSSQKDIGGSYHGAAGEDVTVFGCSASHTGVTFTGESGAKAFLLL